MPLQHILMLVGMPPEEGLKSVVLASGRRDGFSGIKGNWDTLSILMEEMAEQMSTGVVGLENLWKRGRLLLFSH